jgi:acid stress chaperone HdeB
VHRWDYTAGRHSGAVYGEHVPRHVRTIRGCAVGSVAHFLGLDKRVVQSELGYTYINIQAYERNVQNVKAWCADHPAELVMTGLERASRDAKSERPRCSKPGLLYTAVAAVVAIARGYGQARAQLILEMSMLKCKDYLDAPADRQEWIAAWMSGYFNQERNMPIDFKRFATNERLVTNYCQRRENDNLMFAIRRVAF